MALKFLTAKNAALLDKELMGSGAFSIDQLMELAGLAVSQAANLVEEPELILEVFRLHPPSKGRDILVACGPGNNGGDGLVAARHLHHFGYRPTVYYPKRSKTDIYERLTKQLEHLSVPFASTIHHISPSSPPSSSPRPSYIIDALFGFSFTGPVREPFVEAIALLSSTSIPVLSVDAPSSWNIDAGPPSEGAGKEFMPGALISLTAPKPLVEKFRGRHFVGGRFLGEKMAARYGVEVPPFEGDEQVVEVGADGRRV